MRQPLPGPPPPPPAPVGRIGGSWIFVPDGSASPGVEFASAEEAVAWIAPRRLSGTLTAPDAGPRGERPP